jgi:hypothetical protein
MATINPLKVPSLVSGRLSNCKNKRRMKMEKFKNKLDMLPNRKKLYQGIVEYLIHGDDELILEALGYEERMEEVKPVVNRLVKFLKDNDSDWNATKLLNFFDSDLDEYRTKFRDACKNFHFNLIGFWEETIKDLNKATEKKSNNYELIFYFGFMTPKSKSYSFFGKTKHECIEKAITKIKEDGLLIDTKIDNLCEKLYASGYYSLFSPNGKKSLNFHLLKIY